MSCLVILDIYGLGRRGFAGDKAHQPEEKRFITLTKGDNRAVHADQIFARHQRRVLRPPPDSPPHQAEQRLLAAGL